MNRRSIFKSLTAAVVMAALDLKLTAAQFRRKWEFTKAVRMIDNRCQPKFWIGILEQRPLGWKHSDGFLGCHQKIIHAPDSMPFNEFNEILDAELERRRLELEDE